MKGLNHHELIGLLLAIGMMLLAARLFGEFFRKLKMPLVVGELIAGVLLGPTLLGTYFPDFKLFKLEGNASFALSGLTSISVVMLLFTAGMEVELALIRKQRGTAFKTSILGLVLPFALGYLVAYNYYGMFGSNNTENVQLFALFIGTAMAISALPVIARILIDLNLFKTELGMIIIAAAMFDDVIGWILFSVILGMMNKNASSYAFLSTLGYTLMYAVLILSAGRIIINKALPWLHKNFAWPGGTLSIALSLAFLGAAFTEAIGIHAIFGAFIMGIAFGASEHLDARAQDIIHQFVTNVFAPLFFVSVGLKVNFASNFDIQIVALVLVLAIVAKLVGAGLGAYWGGLSLRKSAAVGFGMNARGAMEIILAILALQAGLIAEPLFVGIIIMAVITSIMAGPALQFFLSKEEVPTTHEKELFI